MKDHIINVTAQAKAIRSLCSEYVDEVANLRYSELMKEISENPTISQLVSMIGEALTKEENELEREIEKNLLGYDSVNVYFYSYRYCLTSSKEMKTALRRLMGW